MKRFNLKKVGKNCMVFLLALTMFVGMSSYAFAGSDSTRNASGSSFTRWVGPAVECKYTFVIDGKSYSGTKKIQSTSKIQHCHMKAWLCI